MIERRYRHSLRLALGLFLVGLFRPAAVASEYPPPPLRENERICRNQEGTLAQITCLGEHLARAEENLDHVVTLLEEWLDADSDATGEKERLLTAQEKWREDVEHSCDRMVRLMYGQGSMARTEPIFCRVLMTMERERLLRILYYRPLRFLERSKDH